MTGGGAKLGLMIAAPHSGSGKTVLATGLLRGLRDRGIDLAAAKAGPDYIDAGFHRLATGTESVNLDPWAMEPERLRSLASRRLGTHLLVESMMGLFDGAADGSGSAADLAIALGIPVVLVIDVSRQSHSVAALARGFRDHRDGVEIAGVVLNRVGSERHEALLRDALERVNMPVFGAIARNEALALPSRHLGLVQASEIEDAEVFVERARKAVAAGLDLDRVISAFAPFPAEAPATGLKPLGDRIAVARDAAFSFLYSHMLCDWRDAGAAIEFFSPLADEAPADDCDAIFLPGGYPELHGGQLASAANFKSAMQRHARANTRIYGECGGYMVLGRGLVDRKGDRHEMCGLLELETSFEDCRLHLGYRYLSPLADFAMGRRLCAHEFHYTTAKLEHGEPLFHAEDASGNRLGTAGLRRGNIMGSYMHVIDGQAP